jgi:Homeodomain-like domain
MSSPAASLSIAGHDLATLRQWIQASSIPAALAQRYAREGLAGLADRPRSGWPQSVRRDRRTEILATTLTPPPQHLGLTHWSSRLLADEVGVSHNTVVRVWREHDLKHFTPTYASWLNLVEAFFAIATRQALRRGDFSSVSELVAAIGRFVDGWNQRGEPVRWVKDADQILARLKRHPTSETDRQDQLQHGIAPPG